MVKYASRNCYCSFLTRFGLLPLNLLTSLNVHNLFYDLEAINHVTGICWFIASLLWFLNAIGLHIGKPQYVEALHNVTRGSNLELTAYLYLDSNFDCMQTFLN